MKPGWEQFAQALIARFGGASRRVQRQRQAAIAAPFPAAWREVLTRRSVHFRRVPSEFRRRFEDQTQIFLSEKRITGVTIDLDDEARLLVTASAVSLTVGWSGYTWDQLAEVLVYPQEFNRDYSFDESEYSGIAHHWGVVILSLPSLNRSFDATAGAFHVGVHEFAHLLDLAGTRFDGIPSYLDDQSIRRWVALLESEAERLARNDSILDPYALAGPVELFAVAVEAFFQTPAPLAARHPELYEFLRTYFRQDPASWSPGVDEDRLLSESR